MGSPPPPSAKVYLAGLKYIQEQLLFVGKSLSDFNLPNIDNADGNESLSTRQYLLETLHDYSKLHDQCLLSWEKFNNQQHAVFREIMLSILHSDRNNFFYLNAPAGTGKTFVCNALLNAVRSQKYIALACATTGIAALLLKGGRTLHSRFKLPLVINKGFQLKIEPSSTLARLIEECKLFI